MKANSRRRYTAACRKQASATTILRAGAARHRACRHHHSLPRVVALAVALLPAASYADPAHGVDVPISRLTLTIRIYNDAHISMLDLRHAETEAGRILRSAGVRPDWVDCALSDFPSTGYGGRDLQLCDRVPVAGPTVMLQVLARVSDKGAAVSRNALGYVEGTTLATVLNNRVKDFSEACCGPNEAPQLLGDAMADEIGHLLLGPAHSFTGIMRGRWDLIQGEHAVQRGLAFTPGESKRIRAALEAHSRH